MEGSYQLREEEEVEGGGKGDRVTCGSVSNKGCMMQVHGRNKECVEVNGGGICLI